MQTVKTDQTGPMPRLILVFTRCTWQLVSFVVPWLNFSNNSDTMYTVIFLNFWIALEFDTKQIKLFLALLIVYSVFYSYELDPQNLS